MKKVFVVTAVIISGHLYSQKDSVYQNHQLNEIVVTANKFPQKESETGKVISIIDRSMLDQLGSRSISEILSIAPATFVIGANSNMGANLTTSIRGSSAGNVLILIDGIPVNDPSVITNYYDLNFINTTQIEKIEILKGAQSTIYGSDAVSGVINIITKKSFSKLVTPYASFSYGSYNTSNANAGLKGRNGRISYNLFGSANNSSGFSSAYDSTGRSNFDNDAFHQFSGHADLNFQLSNKIQLSFFENFSYYKTDIDQGAFTDDKDYYTKNKNERAGVNLIWRNNKGAYHFNYEYNYLNRFYLDDSTDRSSAVYYSKGNYTGTTHYAEAYENSRYKNFEFLYGIDYRFYNSNQSYLSVSSYGPYSTELNSKLARMWLLSPYASINTEFSKLNIEVGGRFNHHNIYGNNYTYSFSSSYNINDIIKIFANISTAFKTPTVYQLFDVSSGNINLKAEHATVFEGGIEWYNSKQLKLRTDYFYSNTNNAIQYIYIDPINFTGHYENENNSKRFGIETELIYKSKHWDISANYTYTKGKTTSAFDETGIPITKGDTTYNNLYRIPNNTFNSLVTYHFNKPYTLSVLMKFVGKRLEPVYGSVPITLNNYITFDLSAQYSFNQKTRLFADFKNITNRKYFDILGYNTRRFNYAIGILIGI